MSDSDVSMRRNVVIALHRLASGIDAKGLTKVDIRDSVPALINALRDDGGTSIRAWSAQALGPVQPSRLSRPLYLTRLFDDPSEDVRRLRTVRRRQDVTLSRRVEPATVVLTTLS